MGSFGERRLAANQKGVAVGGGEFVHGHGGSFGIEVAPDWRDGEVVVTGSGGGEREWEVGEDGEHNSGPTWRDEPARRRIC